jgi:hypothetical protein
MARWGTRVAMASCLVHSAAGASTSVEVRCAELGRESAAAFEARAHTELLVRGLSGAVRLDCTGSARLTWTPVDGPERSRAVEVSSPEGLLSDLADLLEREPPSAPASAVTPRDAPEPPPPKEQAPAVVDLCAGAKSQLWGGQAAFGAEIIVGLPIAPLTILVSGNVTRGALSYGGVSLYVLETRAGAEVFLLDSLRLAAGAGAGRPFTTETQAVALVDASSSPWFVEGFLRAAIPARASARLRLDVGAEVALFSRPLRLQVDETRGYDFGWQPGVFLEAAFELR